MKTVLCIICCFFTGMLLYGQAAEKPSSARVVRELIVSAGDIDRRDVHVSVLVDGITPVHDSVLVLYERKDGAQIRTGTQFEFAGSRRILHWTIAGVFPRGTERRYVLVQEAPAPARNHPAVSIEDGENGYMFMMEGRKVLGYNTQIVAPPDGVDRSFERSGFINPLYAPNQTILTRIPDSSDDHLHHYGLWNAWKKVLVGGEEIDFFAPQFGQGTVRHAGVVSKEEGAVFSSLQVLREHITWPDSEEETVVMHDLMDIRVYNTCGRHRIDLSFQYDPVVPFLIKAYRYAGFSFRATDLWTKENSSILTSEGHSRDEADGEGSRWCRVTGDTPEGPVAMLFMSHPANYNHPEPMRIWPSSMNNGTGHVYVNYNPARNTDWALVPGKTYLLRYRVLIMDGTLAVEEAEEAWRAFAYPPSVRLQKVD